VRPVAATLALILIAAALPQLAAAQDDGVFFDPGGPSDKEYAMPHDQARGGGGGSSSGQDGSSGSSGGQGTPQDSGSSDQLFGQGVTSAQRASKRDRNGDTDSANAGAAGAARENAVGLKAASAGTDDAIGVGWFLAIAAAVALLGGGLAYITRSRTRGPDT